MTIQEILEAHQGTAAQFCAACPDYRPAPEELDACESVEDGLRMTQRHQAEVLDKHMQEARAQELVLFARQLSDCVRAQTLAERTPGEPRIAVDVIHLLNSRANQLRKETPNGR